MASMRRERSAIWLNLGLYMGLRKAVVSDQGETFISNDAFHDHRIRSHALASSRWGAQAAAGEDKFRLRALSFY